MNRTLKLLALSGKLDLKSTFFICKVMSKVDIAGTFISLAKRLSLR